MAPMLLTPEYLKRKLDFTQMNNMDTLDILLKITPLALKKLRREDKKIATKEEESTRTMRTTPATTRQQDRLNKGKKKIGRDYFLGDPDLESATIPAAFREYIERELGGRDIKLMIQKHLFRTDLERNEGRFSIPQNKMCRGVLTKEEEDWLTTARGERNQVLGLEVEMVDPELKVGKILLKHWGMKKPNGSVSSMYLLAKYWNGVVKAHGFKEGEEVQLWGFRMGEGVPGKLGLALVRLGRMGNCVASGSGGA